MMRHTLTFRYVDVLPMLSLALIFLWLWLNGVNLREQLANAVLTITGYLRRRPDPAIEHALRVAFTNLDKELAAIIGDRNPRRTFDRTKTHDSKRSDSPGHLSPGLSDHSKTPGTSRDLKVLLIPGVLRLAGRDGLAPAAEQAGARHGGSNRDRRCLWPSLAATALLRVGVEAQR